MKTFQKQNKWLSHNTLGKQGNESLTSKEIFFKDKT